jgi:acetyl-CoA synthetase
MRFDPIVKSEDVQANLLDYDEARRRFSYDDVRARLDGLPGGALNIAHEAVSRHADGERRGHVAIRWLGASGRVGSSPTASSAPRSPASPTSSRTSGSSR